MKQGNNKEYNEYYNKVGLFVDLLESIPNYLSVEEEWNRNYLYKHLPEPLKSQIYRMMMDFFEITDFDLKGLNEYMKMFKVF